MKGRKMRAVGMSTCRPSARLDGDPERRAESGDAGRTRGLQFVYSLSSAERGPVAMLTRLARRVGPASRVV